MKLKQIKVLFMAFLFVIAPLFTITIVGSETAKAYNCFDPNNPSDIYEYHESDGMCWKVRYTDRQQNPPIATCKNGACSCPGGAPFVLNGQCKQACPAGDEYHADTNSCWYKNGYTGNGGQIQPTNNDGTPIAPANSACVDGFIYLPNGNGTNGPGCYDKAPNGSFPCAPDQDVETSGGPRGVTTQSCGDAVKNHLVPKNTQQSADKTKANAACKLQYGGSGKEAQLAACQAAANNPDIDCSKQPNDAQKKACETGQKNSTNNSKGGSPLDQNTGTNCGDATTVVIQCKGEGADAIADVLRIILVVITTIVGIAAVGGLAWASILYAKAEDNQGNVTQAKEWIRNIAIGIILYGFMVAIINWLVPGGVIG